MLCDCVVLRYLYIFSYIYTIVSIYSTVPYIQYNYTSQCLIQCAQRSGTVIPMYKYSLQLAAGGTWYRCARRRGRSSRLPRAYPSLAGHDRRWFGHTRCVRVRVSMEGANPRVYIGNLDPEITTEEMEAEANRYGRTASVWVARNPAGFAFIEYEQVEAAEACVRDLDNVRIGQNNVKVQFAKTKGRKERPVPVPVPRPSGAQKFRAVLRHLPASCDWRRLKDEMKMIGDVIYADVDAQGDGYAFCCLDASKCAQQWHTQRWPSRLLTRTPLRVRMQCGRVLLRARPRLRCQPPGRLEPRWLHHQCLSGGPWPAHTQ